MTNWVYRNSIVKGTFIAICIIFKVYFAELNNKVM